MIRSASLVAEPAEARAFLEAHPQIAFVEIVFTGMNGVSRGKRLRRHELLSVYELGRFMPSSTLISDITGRDVEETRLVWETGDADVIARPVPGTLVPAPWLGPDVAQVLVSLYELDGAPSELDPRHVLRRVVDRFHADGLVPVVACELEYYLIDCQRTRRGGIRLAPVRSTGAPPSACNAYGLREIEDVAPFLRELWAASDAQSIPLEGAISEHSPGQLELTLRHRPDALRAADDAVMYKRAAKGVALRHGCEATFMAKPFAAHAGSGMHLHVSVNDEGGNNIFASPMSSLAAPLRFAIGGMQELLPESFALLAPHANSYRRFKAHSFAPTTAGWGLNNRTVPLRVPAGPDASRHIEHRTAGADANPYLALATILAGAHRGLAAKLDPGPPVIGNGYVSAPRVNPLPQNWFSAVEQLERAVLLREYLGTRFVDAYTQIKRAEQNRFYEVVTSLDYDWYLQAV